MIGEKINSIELIFWYIFLQFAKQRCSPTLSRQHGALFSTKIGEGVPYETLLNSSSTLDSQIPSEADVVIIGKYYIFF